MTSIPLNPGGEGSLDSPQVERAIQAIEAREVNVGGVGVRMRVLSVHPPPSGDQADGVVFRIALRPPEDRETVVVSDASLQARLHEIGITHPFRITGDIGSQVNALVQSVEADAPRILQRVPSPRLVVIERPWGKADALSAVAVVAVIFIVAASVGPTVQAFRAAAAGAIAITLYLIGSWLRHR